MQWRKFCYFNDLGQKYSRVKSYFWQFFLLFLIQIGPKDMLRDKTGPSA